MAVSDGLIAISITILALLYYTGVVQIWHIIVVVMFGSIVGSFHYPAMAATTTLMVPKRHLGRIGGMNQTLTGLASILAPPLGAVLLGLLPMGSILAIDVLTALLAITVVLVLEIPQPEITEEHMEQHVLENLVEGLRYILNWRAMTVIVLVAMMINFVVPPAFTLLPILVAVDYAGDEATFAIIQSTLSMGVVLGGILLSIWGGGRRKIVSGMGILTMTGGGLVLISIGPPRLSLYILAVFFSVGFLVSMVNGLLTATLQGIVPPEIQGRVFALFGSLATAMTPVGLALAGPIADSLGVPFWFLVGGVVTMVTSTLALLSKSIRSVDALDETDVRGDAIQPAKAPAESSAFSTESEGTSSGS
jgi:DHA3 family macrolide efflux protein-like MFS transporter